MKTPRLKFFRAVYFFLTVCLAIAAVLTPSLVKNSLFSIQEEALEGIIIAFFLFTGFILNLIYEGEIKRWQSHLEEAWRHIGKNNVLMDRFKSVLFEIKKYPESKRDIKYVFEAMAEKVLGIVDAPGVMFRVAGKNKNTLSEFFLERGKDRNGSAKIKIGNNELFEGESENFKIISSQAINASARTFCVFPKTEISKEQKMFINKIVDDFTMLYVISAFYISQK
jgi:hypothetical protein